jgi:tRNA nucleotidyltransferase (CCA-adding enzyme)
MKSYLVGGAVRDSLLGLDIHERDYVVVGETEEAMRNAGFRSVGKDFPVFLHPDTHEEYALARTERKTGPGHQGFVCFSSPDVTLEEDLQRRDLTINAIAQDDAGNIIDPLNARLDLDNRILRHVSSAFTEDPLRVLRVARFKATLDHLDFTVHAETMSLLKSMVSEGALAELPPERVQAELNKVLLTRDPAAFFELLAEIGANEVLWPEIDSESIGRLRNLVNDDTETRFAALLLKESPDTVKSVCYRLKCSNLRRDIASLTAKHHEGWQTLKDQTPEQIVEFIFALDGIRKAERFVHLSRAIEALTNIPLADAWISLRDLVASVSARDLSTTVKGPELGKLIRQTQIDKVRQHLA